MIEEKIFNKNGEPVAYVTPGYTPVIYLWDGFPVAYIYEEDHVFGINGKHLGWFVNEVLYTNEGDRIGFTFDTCPVSVAKDPVKGKKHPKDESRPRWAIPSPPKFGYKVADQDLTAFLSEGLVKLYQEGESTDETLAKKTKA